MLREVRKRNNIAGQNKDWRGGPYRKVFQKGGVFGKFQMKVGRVLKKRATQGKSVGRGIPACTSSRRSPVEMASTSTARI